MDGQMILAISTPGCEPSPSLLEVLMIDNYSFVPCVCWLCFFLQFGYFSFRTYLCIITHVLVFLYPILNLIWQHNNIRKTTCMNM